MGQVITVTAAKGGVGKTTLAIQLAAARGAVLVDLDYETGGATGALLTQTPRRGTVLDAFERGPGYLPGRGFIRAYAHRPALLPNHPDLATTSADHELVRECLEAWADGWGRDVVVDTAPGYSELAMGAGSAARLVVVPILLEPNALRSLAGFLGEWGDHPLLLVPNMVPRRPPAGLVRMLERLGAPRIPISSPIGEHRVLRRRLRRGALVLETAPGREVKAAVDDFRRVAEEVEAWLSDVTASQS